MKSEIRNPKSEASPKAEIRNRFNGGLMFNGALAALSRRRSGSGFGFRISFGLRTSAFGLSRLRRAGEPSQVSPAGIACPAGNSERSSSAERSSITVF